MLAWCAAGCPLSAVDCVLSAVAVCVVVSVDVCDLNDVRRLLFICLRVRLLASLHSCSLHSLCTPSPSPSPSHPVLSSSRLPAIPTTVHDNCYSFLDCVRCLSWALPVKTRVFACVGQPGRQDVTRRSHSCLSLRCRTAPSRRTHHSCLCHPPPSHSVTKHQSRRVDLAACCKYKLLHFRVPPLSLDRTQCHADGIPTAVAMSRTSG
jgi:hypothetical protein